MALQLSAQQLHIHCPKDKQAPLSRLSQCFHGCWISLFLISSLHSTEYCCHALYSRPRSTLQSAREREIEREGVRVGGSTGENLAFTVRHQQYITGGQTILLHAVFLTNDYTNKQYARILYTSKAACQALITIAPFERLTRARREIRKL